MHSLCVAIMGLVQAMIVVLWRSVCVPFVLAGIVVSLFRVRGFVLRLTELGLGKSFMWAIADWRMGAYDSAFSRLEGIITVLEEWVVGKQKKGKTEERIIDAQMVIRGEFLLKFYTLVARLAMRAGRIDDTMLIIIRANKLLGVERLPRMSSIDVKVAHLIRASISAGKILDSGGTATLSIKTVTSTEQRRRRKPKEASNKSKGKEGKYGKVIPFVRKHQQQP